MCLLFIYLNQNPKPNGYHLILANNRDEFYKRRTDPAKFLDGSTIAGTDQTEGKEDGTWLAMNRNGKIAALLNILQPTDELKQDAEGRGFLAMDFVQGSDDALTFLNKLCTTATSRYNGFLLVTLDVDRNAKDTKGAYYTNMSSDLPQKLKPSSVQVFGNSPPVRLWQKASKGCELFEGIVGSEPTIAQRDELVQSLFRFLKDPTSYELDDQILKQGSSMTQDDLQRLNSVFVTIPKLKYGTRSHTLILVDAKGEVEYIESSMKEPINLKEGVSWVDIQEKFALH